MSIVVSYLRSVVRGPSLRIAMLVRCFFTFMLEPKLRPFAGVNLTCLFPEDIFAENEFIRKYWEIILMEKKVKKSL